jgi:YbbR domain-containing protein
VTVNVNGVGEDFTKKATPVAYDSNGEEVVSSTLDYGVSKVRVNIHVLQTKTIPVNINITGSPADGYQFVGAECLPEEIQVAGAQKKLEGISKIDIPIDISGMRSTSGYVEQNISIQDYLPDGLTVLADYAQVSLRIEIEKMMSKTISIPVEDIKFASLSDSLSAKIVSTKPEVELVVKGLSSELDALDESSYTAYVDCENLKAGKYRLKVQLDLDDNSILAGSEKVTVKITSSQEVQESEAPQSEGQPTASPETGATDSGKEEE